MIYAVELWGFVTTAGWIVFFCWDETEIPRLGVLLLDADWPTVGIGGFGAFGGDSLGVKVLLVEKTALLFPTTTLFEPTIWLRSPFNVFLLPKTLF